MTKQIYVARCPHCGSGYDFYKAFNLYEQRKKSMGNFNAEAINAANQIVVTYNKETECLNCKKMYSPADK